MRKSHRNIEITFENNMLTHFGGLYLLQQFFQKVKLRSALARTIRFRQINHRYSISDSILAILYPILLGLGRIEIHTLLQQNGVFQYLASLPTYPDPTTLRRFLERFGSRGLHAFQNLHDRWRGHFLMKPAPLSSVLFCHRACNNDPLEAAKNDPSQQGRGIKHERNASILAPDNHIGRGIYGYGGFVA